MAETPPLRARIEGLAYGAHALTRIDGKVYFVRNAAPGDEVELEVREDHGTYAFADVTQMLHAGAARRVPPCEYLPRCGGCPWQHIDYTTQLAAKERSVADLLTRVGGFAAPQVLPILASPAELGYRRRLSLRVEDGRLGYFAGGSHDLVAVAHCLLGAGPLDGALPLAQAWIETQAARIKRIEIAATGEADRLAFAAQVEGAQPAGDAAATEAFLARHARVAGISMHGRGWRGSWGNPRVRIEIEIQDGSAPRPAQPALRGAAEIATMASEEPLRRPPPAAGGGTGRGRAITQTGVITLPVGAFTQVNAAANDLLVATVLAFARVGPSDRVLDLYAGFGNLTFPLARSAAAVTGVERDGEGVRAGDAYARAHGLERVHFVAADAARYLERCGRRFDLVVLDPPRSGAADAVGRLLELRPARLVYVSCNPSTLARDLRRLSAAYTLGRVQPLDFFPQTYHVEAVAELWLTDR